MSLDPHARAPFGGAYLARRPPERSAETRVLGQPPGARLRGAGRAGPGRAPPLSPSRPQALTGHFQQLHEVLKELEAASRRLRRLEALRRDFELQKVCYLPLNAFLLKPLQRLRHYRLLLRRLCAPGPGDSGLHSQDRADLRGECPLTPRSPPAGPFPSPPGQGRAGRLLLNQKLGEHAPDRSI